MRRKYGNHKVTFQGMKFDSELELARYLFLLNRQKEGKISDLRRQVEYCLIPPQYRTEIVQLKTKAKEKQVLVERECAYKADFVYERDGKLVVEDVKGARFLMTADFKIKKKLLLYRYGIAIQIVTEATFWQKD